MKPSLKSITHAHGSSAAVMHVFVVMATGLWLRPTMTGGTGLFMN